MDLFKSIGLMVMGSILMVSVIFLINKLKDAYNNNNIDGEFAYALSSLFCAAMGLILFITGFLTL